MEQRPRQRLHSPQRLFLPEISHLFATATYYKARIDGNVRDCATPSPSASAATMAYSSFSASPAPLFAAEVHWRKCLTNLQERDIGIPEGLTIFSLPEAGRQRLRASNESSLLRLVAVVLIEVSEEWETGKFYLQPEANTEPVAIP